MWCFEVDRVEATLDRTSDWSPKSSETYYFPFPAQTWFWSAANPSPRLGALLELVRQHVTKMSSVTWIWGDLVISTFAYLSL